jgi:hypothetical protein
MPIRFQADADLNQIIVTAIVRRFSEIDFRTATAAGLTGLKDADVLALTARDGRVLVTHDQTTILSISPISFVQQRVRVSLSFRRVSAFEKPRTP